MNLYFLAFVWTTGEPNQPLEPIYGRNYAIFAVYILFVFVEFLTLLRSEYSIKQRVNPSKPIFERMMSALPFIDFQ